MARKKKLLTSAVALGTAAALTLGGTFAWQSISQGAVNEASDVVNPGGRLHNDQHWVSDLENDTNIYVENFTEEGKGEDIYARVRLSEYMEVVMNYGTKAEVVDVVAGSKTLKDGVTKDDEGNDLTDESATQQNKFDYEYDIHYFGEENKTDDFFTWTEGEADIDLPWFIPTFNKNKDSVAADLNGEYADTLGGITNRGESQYDYEEITEDTEDVTASAIYDADYDKDDELKTLSYSDLKMLCETGGKMQNTTVQAALDNKDIMLVEETHAATQVGETRGLIALSDWLELDEDTDNYWVYDDSEDEDGNAIGDGWVYWSAPIAAGETTGLLLDGFELNGVMDDTWYYAIDVQAQFVTADDVGKANDTGFYADGETVSENAETLLELIGVDMSGESDADDDDDDDDWTGNTELFNLRWLDGAWQSSYRTGSNETDFISGLPADQENEIEVNAIGNVELEVSFSETVPGTSYENGVVTLAVKDRSNIIVTASYDETDYTFTFTPVYDEIVITKDDTAESVVYQLPGDAYNLKAVGFTGDVTYTISKEAMRSRIDERDGTPILNLSGYESASSYTVKAMDASGNTGTVKIEPKNYSVFDGALFWLYKDYGEYGFRGIGQLIRNQTYYWEAGDEYRVSLDLPVRPTANFTWALTDDNTGEEADEDKINFTEGDGVLTIKCGDSLTAGDTFTLKATSDTALPSDNDGNTTQEYTFYLNFGERPEDNDGGYDNGGSEDTDNGDNGGGETDPDEGESHVLTSSIDVNSFKSIAAKGKPTIAFYSVNYDEETIDSSKWENLTAKVYKKGETEEPVFTASSDDFYEYSYYDCSFDMPMSLITGETNEFDVYLTYTEDGEETTSDKMSMIYVNDVLTLKAGGCTYAMSELKIPVTLKIEGVENPWAGMTASEVAAAMKVTYTDKETDTELDETTIIERDYSTTETRADWTIRRGIRDDGIISMDRTEEDEVQAVRLCTLYNYTGGITFAVTLNGTEYSVTFAPAET